MNFGCCLSLDFVYGVAKLYPQHRLAQLAVFPAELLPFGYCPVDSPLSSMEKQIPLVLQKTIDYMKKLIHVIFSISDPLGFCAALHASQFLHFRKTPLLFAVILHILHSHLLILLHTACTTSQSAFLAACQTDYV